MYRPSRRQREFFKDRRPMKLWDGVARRGACAVEIANKLLRDVIDQCRGDRAVVDAVDREEQLARYLREKPRCPLCGQDDPKRIAAVLKLRCCLTCGHRWMGDVTILPTPEDLDAVRFTKST